jgi:hypothetical protein
LQICWKWKKVVTEKPQKDSFRQFLDGQQYTQNGILRYERIFGPGFVSTGGIDTTKVRLWPPLVMMITNCHSLVVRICHMSISMRPEEHPSCEGCFQSERVTTCALLGAISYFKCAGCYTIFKAAL